MTTEMQTNTPTSEKTATASASTVLSQGQATVVVPHASGSRSELLARLSMGHFFADIFAGFMLPLLPMLAHKLHLGLGVTGLLLTCSSFSSSVLQPGMGWLSDRYKGVNYTLLGVVIAAVFISQIGTSTSLGQLMVLIFCGYLGVGFFHPQGTTLADQLAKGDRNAVMGMFISIGTLGFATGPILSSTLVSYLGLEGTVWAASALLLVVPLLWGVQQRVRAYQQVESSQVHAEMSTPDAAQVKGLKALSKEEWLLLAKLSVIGMCRAVLLVGLPTYLPFLWTEKGYSVQVVGWVIGLSSLVGVPFGIWAGKLGDRLGEKLLMILSFVPTLILLPAMFLLDDVWGFGCFVLLTGCLEATLATSLVIGLKGIKAYPNTISAIVGGFSWGVAGVMMPLIGWLGETFGLVPVLAGLLLPALVAAVLSCLLPGKNHPAFALTPKSSL